MHTRMRLRQGIALLCLAPLALAAAPPAKDAPAATEEEAPPRLQIASLNPIVSDLARHVGGEAVHVIDLMPVDANPHTFYPSPDHLKEASRSALVLAAGKGLEPYLPEFRESLGSHVPLLEVGDSVPSITLTADHHTHDHTGGACPAHTQAAIDPHWWHSIRNAQRAARAIARQLAEIDPARAALYEQQCATYTDQLDALSEWARQQIATIPRQDRELATSHAAFGYLCREFGLRAITVQGLTTEEQPTPGYLKEVVAALKAQHVRAVFPERNANPKVLASMVREANVRIGGELCAGAPPTSAPTYEAMMRTNITTIVESLRRNE